MGKMYKTCLSGRVLQINLEPHLVIHDSVNTQQAQVQYIMFINTNYSYNCTPEGSSLIS